ncbi:organic hydroperoxide resistance protein [Paracoccus saliphilus]|uniref:Organic hydroperoxide resistance protein n=1 Tax=Paracoccus saliphilus TaxID=405559 RepID=A0AA45W6F2_9RHOB|nr:organic hydroperoxide resistance protein [Paracoccus saliphilus]WCR04439.1 organic hydroperoxide resistance protein [Paracoccus saliphilus]SIT01339.1 peroxiredoxin, Ohr subfamily [Paracoccus saliphilus]
MPTKNVAYRTSATATGGGRDGKSKVDDGSFTADLTVPKELGGPGGDGLNPEKLFATGYAACFMGAMRHYAASKKIAVPDDASVQVSVGIGPREDTGFGLDVEISVSLPGVDRETAEDLVAGGHVVCPYSDATRGSLNITPKLA